MTNRNFEDWIEAFMEYTDNSESPNTFRRWTAVSCVASVLERKTFFTWEKRQYPNMYIVLVGPSGVRKGTAMNPAAELLKETKIKMSADSVTREALIKDLDEASFQSLTPDGRAITHSSMTIWSEELSVFLGYNNQELMMALTDWFDCKDEWSYRTKNSGANFIKGVWVNFLGATTPTLLRNSMPMDAIGGGLTSRIVFVYEENRAKDVIFPFADNKDDTYRRWLIEDLVSIRKLIGEYRFTEDFLDIYADWYKNDHLKFEEENKGTFLESYVTRRRIHHLKLSVILTAARRNDLLVTAKDFERAIRYFKEIEKNMLYTFTGMGDSPEAKIMARIIAFCSTKKKVYLHEIFERFQYDALRDKLYLILQSLRDAKAITMTQLEKDPNDAIIEWIREEQ